MHWNWSIVETRQLLNKSGETLQKFPSVTSESVIRSNGRRCNALTAWGDGRQPYMKDADPDERCQAFNAMGTPFQVALLLEAPTPELIDQSDVRDTDLRPSRSLAHQIARLRGPLRGIHQSDDSTRSLRPSSPPASKAKSSSPVATANSNRWFITRR